MRLASDDYLTVFSEQYCKTLAPEKQQKRDGSA